MIPNQSAINYDTIKPMLIQRYAGHTKFDFINIEALDDYLFDSFDDEIDHGLCESVIIDDWVHVDFEAFIPNPELDKILWELTKLYAKYDLIYGGNQDRS